MVHFVNTHYHVFGCDEATKSFQVSWLFSRQLGLSDTVAQATLYIVSDAEAPIVQESQSEGRNEDGDAPEDHKDMQCVSVRSFCKKNLPNSLAD
jgi:hypothetical protein